MTFTRRYDKILKATELLLSPVFFDGTVYEVLTREHNNDVTTLCKVHINRHDNTAEIISAKSGLELTPAEKNLILSFSVYHACLSTLNKGLASD